MDGQAIIQFFTQNQWVSTFVIFWVLPWKGWALWRAAQRCQKIWFVVLLVLNTIGILEILYIFVFSKNKKAVCACPCDDCKKTHGSAS